MYFESCSNQNFNSSLISIQLVSLWYDCKDNLIDINNYVCISEYLSVFF